MKILELLNFYFNQTINYFALSTFFQRNFGTCQ